MLTAGMALAVCLAVSKLGAQAPQPQRSFWAFVVNDVPKGDVIAAVYGDRVWLPVAALEKAGLRGFEGRREVLFGEPHVLIQSLEPGITITLDMTEVVLRLTASARFFDETRVVLQRARPAGITAAQSRSAFLNYSATWDHEAGTSGFGETGFALHDNTSVVTGFNVYPDGVVARGLSTLTFDRPRARQRLQIGDIVTTATPLGSGATVGGVAFGRDYSLDPYYYRYPTPFVRGTTTAPSDVEIYVNDVLVRRLSIAPGPYRFDRLPLNSGLGNLRVVVRDRLGRGQTYQSAAYLATGVLRKGDQDYQYAVGANRDDSGETPVYGTWDAAAYHRAGLTNWLTAGFTAEGNENVASGGPTLNLRLGLFGEADLQASASRTSDGTRGLGLYGLYTFTSQRLNLGATVQRFGDGFANLFLEPGASTSPELYQATAGVPVFRTGSVNYTWEARRTPAGAFTVPSLVEGIEDVLVRSQSHSLRAVFRLFSGAQLSGTATYTTARGKHVWTGFAGLNVTLGRQTTASVTYANSPGTESTFASLDRSVPVGVGYGYRFSGSDVQGGTASGQFDINMPHTELAGHYDLTEGGKQHAASVTLAGAVIATRGGVFFTREVQQSAAVVEVEGLKGVRVLADNVPIGRTNGSGHLLIPEMLPYLANRISLDQHDIPFEYSVPVLSQLVAPPFRGAAYVKFETARIQGRDGLVRMVIDGEEIVPSYGGIVVRLDGRTVESPLNRNGEFFLDLPDGHHTATVTYKGQTCQVELDATLTQELVQHLGMLRCRP